MSRAIGSTISLADAEARITRRAQARALAAEKVEALRDWRQARIVAAEKREKERAIERNARPRGVDRVPARLNVHVPAPEPVLYGKHDVDEVRPLAQPEDLHSAGNYEMRRARGQRGHQRPRRTREMPGAVARRLERNRKAALDGAWS